MTKAVRLKRLEKDSESRWLLRLRACLHDFVVADPELTAFVAASSDAELLALVGPLLSILEGEEPNA